MRSTKDKSIAVILYGNPDYYPPTINAVKILENEHKVIIFSRNVEKHLEQFGHNTVYYRFGRNCSVRDSANKHAILKLLEYISFTFRTLFYSRQHKCRAIIAYDNYAFTTALLLKAINKQIEVCYHGHEEIESKISGWLTLRFWMDKITVKNLHRCVWVSQACIKRRDTAARVTGIKNVKVVRNFALKNFRPNVHIHPIVSELRNNGYVIAVYTGIIADYIEDIVRYVKSSDMKIAVFLAGHIRDNNIYTLLKNHRNNRIAKLVYTGFLARNEMYELLNSSDFALVLYSLSSFSIHLAGACTKVGGYLAHGLPVIYPCFWNDEPYFKEIGLDYKNAPTLIAQIEKISRNTELRNRMSENARRLYSETLNYEKEFSKFKETIDCIMHKQ